MIFRTSEGIDRTSLFGLSMASIIHASSSVYPQGFKLSASCTACIIPSFALCVPFQLSSLVQVRVSLAIIYDVLPYFGCAQRVVVHAVPTVTLPPRDRVSIFVSFFIPPPDYCSHIPSTACESDACYFHIPASDKAKALLDMRLQYMQSLFQRHDTYVLCYVPRGNLLIFVAT